MMERELRQITVYAQAQYDAFKEYSEALGSEPSDEVIHELRLVTRRTRALLWVLRHGAPRLRFKVLDRELRLWGKALGRVREVDVAIKDAKFYDLDASLLITLRKKHLKSLQTLARKHQKQLRQEIKELRNTVAGLRSFKAQRGLSVLRRRLASQRRVALKGPSELHCLRIKVKKTRYALEVLGVKAASLKRIQDSLGRVHDLQVLEDYLGPVAAIKKDIALLNQKAIRLVQSTLNKRSQAPARHFVE